MKANKNLASFYIFCYLLELRMEFGDFLIKKLDLTLEIW
jgi:hypothetical protein